MPGIRETRRMPYSCEQMFDLVADVGRYGEFLPWVVAVRVRSDSESEMIADMLVGFKAIRENFTTRVTLDRASNVIVAEYIDGPFRSLENRWTFRDLPSGDGPAGCTVEFFITYEFKSRMLGLLMGSMFEGAFSRFAEAFERRADMVYARRASVAPPTGEG